MKRLLTALAAFAATGAMAQSRIGLNITPFLQLGEIGNKEITDGYHNYDNPATYIKAGATISCFFTEHIAVGTGITVSSTYTGLSISNYHRRYIEFPAFVTYVTGNKSRPGFYGTAGVKFGNNERQISPFAEAGGVLPLHNRLYLTAGIGGDDITYYGLDDKSGLEEKKKYITLYARVGLGIRIGNPDKQIKPMTTVQ